MMKQIVFAVAAALGVTAFATPAHAVRFKWTVDYTGFFAEGAAISGSFVAEESAAADGIVSGDEFDSWMWNWSGNSDVEAFTISSANAEVVTLFGTPGFFVDGTANEVELADGLDQGTYISDEFGLDLEFLFVDNFAAGTTAFGDTAAAGSIMVSEPEQVPEPATIFGFLAVAGGFAVAKRQKQTA
ncbi:MAG: PEP-CTERM sorting domain-containing protein [Cyanobacteria bacterium P01_A01_bin.15]